MACLGEETILTFAEGRLGAVDLARVDAHTRVCPSCDEVVTAALPPPATTARSVTGGEVGAICAGTLIGRYVAEELVGIGGMSEVYAAYDPVLDRMIALKFLRKREVGLELVYSDRIGHAESNQDWLFREARLTARLRHPNVIGVYDVGTFRGRAFIALELVDGQTLSHWLLERQRSWREIVTVFIEAARGLGAAHAASVVHRDFKPQNVMIGRDGRVTVTDFGMAQIRDQGACGCEPPVNDTFVGRYETRTGPNGIVGTPFFIAPERFAGDPADALGDQFSFCVSLYQALYRRHPFFDRATPFRADTASWKLCPAPANAIVPTWLRDVIVRGLSLRKQERWRSMDELERALDRDRRRATRRLPKRRH